MRTVRLFDIDLADPTIQPTSAIEMATPEAVAFRQWIAIGFASLLTDATNLKACAFGHRSLENNLTATFDA